MIVRPEQFGELWDTVLEESAGSIEKGAVVLTSVSEVDSVCADRVIRVRANHADVLGVHMSLPY